MADDQFPLEGNGVGGGRRRVRSREVITYADVIQQMLNGDFDSFTERYSFCQIRTHHLQPGESLEDALNTHVKVALDPDVDYEITNPVLIRTNCYLIGNGASITVKCHASAVFVISNTLSGPSITGMHYATITGVKFLGSHDIKGHVIFACSHLMIHGCDFLNFTGTCIRSTTGIVVRGCLFAACDKPLRCDGDYVATLKQNTFKNCLVCIATKNDFEIVGNVCDESYCFLLTSGTGRMINNSITCAVVSTLDRYKDLDLLTCFGGTLNPLCTVHIVENRHKFWPKMDGNSFYRARIFCGFRRGVLSPHHCAFHYSHVCLDMNSENKLSLNGSYDQSIKVSKMVSVDMDNTVMAKCECGVRHLAPVPVFTSITEDVKVDPYAQSCHSLEFSSDEE
ncbi:E1B 55 kDa protein [red squirrel adenovirus 1]|uniref:E1B 55 kDa protein n=1 Tax=red squirrel adenovirus 1 TaxID=2773314 RepID=A0A240FBF8_9ADEN|nr:E1B 55 kDa protein [red squirrel adenovirus 1]ARE31878.1 E1B 55 kDa protein [red squirrel adenovirus 1]